MVWSESSGGVGESVREEFRGRDGWVVERFGNGLEKSRPRGEPVERVSKAERGPGAAILMGAALERGRTLSRLEVGKLEQPCREFAFALDFRGEGAH